MGRLLATVVAVTVLISQQCNAQTTDNLLRRVSKIQLVIETLGTDAMECGLAEQAIRAAAMYPLSSAKIEIASRALVHFYINVNSVFLREDRLCISNLHIKVYTFGDVTFAFSGDEKQGVEVVLWDTGYVASSGRSSHARYIAGGIEDQVKRFITDWNLDNKPGMFDDLDSEEAAS